MKKTDGGGRIRFSAIPAVRLAAVSVLALALANCSSAPTRGAGKFDAQQSREFNAFPQGGRYGKASPRVASEGQAIPKGGGRNQVGRPYRINGKVYRPYVKPDGFTQTGSASWYGAAFHGRKTANGEIYDRRAFSAAHPTMPLPSYARVTNLRNGYSIVVRVNDRGPYHGGRIIDLSERTAEVLDFKRTGTARVKVDYLSRASLAGSDDNRLLASLRRDGAPASMGDENVQVAMAEPAYTPAPQPRRAVHRPVVASAALPGFETAQPVRMTSEPLVPTQTRPRIEEPMVAVAPAGDSDTSIAFAAPAAGRAVQPLAAPAVPGGDESGAAVPAAEALADSFGALYYSEPGTSLNQPAAAWRLSDDASPAAPRLYEGGDYALQAGLFRNLSNAERLARTLDGDAPATVTAKQIKGELVYSVTVGPIPDRDAADAILRRAVGAGAAGAKLRRS